ncbi:methyltransferase domain-containing protein [Colletotrichum musicola]|uniref:Methyltransferase domain-containing protein n=1 Tax=Colletotrichum musicola TaxID=2175873 RepID=A0A8H6KVJ4_9PEZI|nr:methyltransferase domain-containing protein [Colletotrichum musicola]
MAQVDHEVQIVPEDNTDASISSWSQSLASSTTSLADSIRDYHFENGRSYHRYKEGKYHFPNDEKENDRLDLQHHLALLTLGGRLGLAPPCDPEYKVGRALDVGTGTGIWAIQYADDHPETEVKLPAIVLFVAANTWGNLGVLVQWLTFERRVAPNLRFEVDDIEEEWTYSQPFHYIHSRHMTSSLADWKEYITNCFNNLTPGGYLELQEAEMAFLSDDASLPADAALVRFAELVKAAGAKFGRRFVVASELRDLMREVGFQDVSLSRYKWPMNDWPRDARFRELGMWNFQNGMAAADGLALAPLTRAHGWTREEVEVFLVDVRADLRNKRYHTYVPMYFLVGRKPLEEVSSAGETPAAQV